MIAAISAEDAAAASVEDLVRRALTGR
jgi:hypothetical protein